MCTASRSNLRLHHPVIVMQIWTQKCTEEKIKCVKMLSHRELFFFSSNSSSAHFSFKSGNCANPDSISVDLVRECIRHGLASQCSAVPCQARLEGRGINLKDQLIQEKLVSGVGLPDRLQHSQEWQRPLGFSEILRY